MRNTIFISTLSSMSRKFEGYMISAFGHLGCVFEVTLLITAVEHMTVEYVHLSVLSQGRHYASALLFAQLQPYKLPPAALPSSNPFVRIFSTSDSFIFLFFRYLFPLFDSLNLTALN